MVQDLKIRFEVLFDMRTSGSLVAEFIQLINYNDILSNKWLASDSDILLQLCDEQALIYTMGEVGRISTFIPSNKGEPTGYKT
ncbi:unnamed protein product [Penicillium camemberti]|uniref:Str. FM013 n=1 Tax=Penicillium camemberti (strain FM 013) TaxID=1429867 RepID=A0A0G4PSW6_PENC3|nr:unnamed protein product [Penicillium camemberti]